MEYKVQIEIDAEEVLEKLDLTAMVELLKKLGKQYLDLGEILEIAREGYTDMDILKEMDIDDIIQHLKNEGYAVIDTEE